MSPGENSDKQLPIIICVRVSFVFFPDLKISLSVIILFMKLNICQMYKLFQSNHLQIVIATPPFLCPFPTYSCASAICSRG